MTAWQIEASWTAAHVDEDTETEQAEALLDGLAPQHIGAVIHPAAGPAGWWGITITIEAPTLRQANALALALLTAAVGNAGQKSVTWRELAIVEQPEADRRLLEPDVPDLVAFADIAETAGVSRQRARQLAESPTFPGPVYDGRAGRLFVKAEVDRFMAAPWPPRSAKEEADGRLITSWPAGRSVAFVRPRPRRSRVSEATTRSSRYRRSRR